MKIKFFAPCEWFVCRCGRQRIKVKHISRLWGTGVFCKSCLYVWQRWEIVEQIWVSTAVWWKPLTWCDGYLEDYNRYQRPVMTVTGTGSATIKLEASADGEHWHDISPAALAQELKESAE